MSPLEPHPEPAQRRWWQKGPRKPDIYAPPRACECGNEPLTKEDIAADGKCRCCRDGHVSYHDDLSCRRCGCPHEMWPR